MFTNWQYDITEWRARRRIADAMDAGHERGRPLAARTPPARRPAPGRGTRRTQLQLLHLANK